MPESATARSSSLPKAVRRAARAAERAHEQAYGDSKPPKAEGAAEQGSSRQPDPDAAPPSGEVVALQAGASQDSGVTSPPSASAESQPAAQASTPAEPPASSDSSGSSASAEQPPAADDDIEKWKQRYSSLQGMIKARDREIESLQRSLAAITQLKKEEPPAAAPSDKQETPAQRRRRLKQEDVDAYGDDFIKVVQDAAVDAVWNDVGPELERLRAENAKLREQFGGVEKRTAQSENERVLAFLNANVPDWPKINEDPEFLEWLRQVDPMSGEQRQALLDRATQSHDAPRIAHFFQAYLTENQAIRSNPGAAPAAPAQPAPQAQARQPRTPPVDAAQMVAPGRPSSSAGTGAGAASDGESPPVTESMIAKFYDDVARGKYKQRPKEYQATQARIAKALASGTVVRDIRAR